MGWCKLGADEGAQAVADLLMFNTTLASVDLRGNGLGDAGAIFIWQWVLRSGALPSGEGRAVAYLLISKTHTVLGRPARQRPMRCWCVIGFMA